MSRAANRMSHLDHINVRPTNEERMNAVLGRGPTATVKVELTASYATYVEQGRRARSAMSVLGQSIASMTSAVRAFGITAQQMADAMYFLASALNGQPRIDLNESGYGPITNCWAHQRGCGCVDWTFCDDDTLRCGAGFVNDDGLCFTHSHEAAKLRELHIA